MNKKIILLITLLITVLLVLTIIIININKKGDPEVTGPNYVDLITPKEYNWIHSLTKYDIKGTNDTFEITKAVKFDVDTGDGNTTVSFAIEIPYTITVDGTEYNGVYILGDIAENEQYNPKYNVEVTNLTSDGAIEVKLEYK